MANAVSDNTQSERRMLSPVLKRIPWTTDVMQVLEHLDPNQKNGEIIANILFYEKQYLLNGGISIKSSEMQDLLGIQYRQVGSSYQFISKPAPSWTYKQALKVCNLVCTYKLAEIVSIDNNSVQFGTILHQGPSESTPFEMPSEATQIMKKISPWPKVLETFSNSYFVSEPSSAAAPGLTSQPASLQLLHALSDTNGRKIAAKIQHNILIAAAHIAYIKEHHVNGGDLVSDNHLPDLPDLTSLHFSEQLKANLTQAAGTYISNLCTTSGKANPNSSLRFPLQLALLISPLCLLLPLNLEKRSFNRNSLMQWAIHLGADKPEVLQLTEKRIWKGVLDIVNQPGDYLTLLKDLASAFSPTYIQELLKKSETATAWFDINFEHSTVPASVRSDSPSPLEDVIIPLTQLETSTLPPPSLASQSFEHSAVPASVRSDSPRPLKDPIISLPRLETSALPPPSLSSQSGSFEPLSPLTPIVCPEPDEAWWESIRNPIGSKKFIGNEETNSNEGRIIHTPQLESSALSSPYVSPQTPSPIDYQQVVDEFFNSFVFQAKDATGGDSEKNDSSEGSDSGTEQVDKDEDASCGENGGEGLSLEGMNCDGSNSDSEMGGGDLSQGEKKCEELDSDDEVEDASQGEKGGDLDCGEKDDGMEEVDEAGEIEDSKTDYQDQQALRRSSRPMNSEPSKYLSTSSRIKRRNGHRVQKRVGLSGEDSLKILAEKPQMATLEDSDAKFHLGKSMTVYDIEGNPHTFTPRLNIQSDLALLRAFYELVEENYVTVGAKRLPLHVQKDPRSIFEEITEAEFNNLPTRDAQEMLRKRHIVMTGISHRSLEFSEKGFSTLEKTMTALISIQDQSVKVPQDDYSNQQKIGTLNQILKASRRKRGRILNALDLPRSLSAVTGSQLTSEVSAWRATQDRPFCKDSYPTADNYWELVATKGARSWMHIDADGLGTRFEVGCGAKWMVLGRPPLAGEDTGTDDCAARNHTFFSDRRLFSGDFAVEDAGSAPWQYEAVYLAPGTALLMRPNTPHMVFTIEDSICRGSHFYATSTLTDTFAGIVHCLIADNVVTNTSHFSSRALLLRMIHYFHEEFVVLDNDYKDFGHLPDLTTMTGLLDFLSLCNMGILFNVLDRRTYGTPDQSRIDSLRRDQHDYNSIPDDDRRKYIYARGLSLELVHWLNSRLIVTCVEGNADPQDTLEIEDLHVQRLTRQGLTMLQYVEKWTEETKKQGFYSPNVDKGALEKQLQWAMHTVPWIATSWSDTLKERAESFYLDSLYPDSGNPQRRNETRTYVPWSRKKIYQMGMTKGDTLYFQGAESYYLVAGPATGKFTRENNSLVMPSLKRNLGDTSPTAAKRRRVSQQS